MEFFSLFCLLLGAGLIAAAFWPERIGNECEYNRSLLYLGVAIALYYPVSGLFMLGVYLSFVARPIAFIMAILSLQALCRALAASKDNIGKSV